MLSAGVCACLAPVRPADAVPSAHRGPGLFLPPLPVPPMPVVLDDGRRTDLASQVRGRVTALQFVLTGCGSICPILGTIFARVQDTLAAGAVTDYQLLSLGLDPFGDTPPSFTKWLARYNAGRHWRGAIPQTDAAGIVSMLRAWGLSSGTTSVLHTETVLLIDRNARLVFRFPDLPDPASVAAMMQQLLKL
jgi:protein SCO1/2